MNLQDPRIQQHLRLADHMRACVRDDQVVLLDLDRGRYLSLGGPHAKIVASVIGAEDSTDPSCRVIEDGELVAPLLRARILTTATTATPPRQCLIHPPITSIDVHDAAAGTPVRLLDLYRFLSATALAALWLRFRTLRSITEAVGARHRQCERKSTDHASRLRSAVAVFARLRPLTFTSKDKCLFDSLALAMFLARQGISARWVIGVSTRPFRAHSWIQDEHEVLNDLHEYVGRFTPILVV